MRKTTKDYSKTESLGHLLNAFTASILFSEFAPILERHGITKFDPDTWYPTTIILELFDNIEHGPNGSENLVSIGIKVTEVLDLKGQFPTLSAFLEVMPQMEQQMHRNNPGAWEVHPMGHQCIEVVDRTLWPHDLEYGVLYGVARSFKGENTYLVKRMGIETDAKTGDEIGRYQITW